MMLTKEEYEKALNSFCDNCKYGYDCKIMKKYNGCVQMNTLNQLIKEHFEILEVLKDCGFGELTSKGLKVVIEAGQYSSKKLNELRSPQPYKFEDLKELIGKPIFDYKYKEFYILAEVKEEELYKDEGLEKIMICSDKKGLLRVFFEEGRFFPVIKAIEYQK